PVLLPHGKANARGDGVSPVEAAPAAALRYQQPGVHPLVLDTENGAISLGFAGRIAERAGARYVRLADLSAESVAASVHGVAAAATG
ncbi:MAG: VWA domain-containing protein, partial [Dehalococcoidia bacterium]